MRLRLILPVLAFTLGISVIAGLLFALGPAFSMRGPRLAAGLRGGGRSLTGAGNAADPGVL